MYATQLNLNFNTTSMAYLVKSEDRRSLRKSQPECNTVFVFFDNFGYVTAIDQNTTYRLHTKLCIRGHLPGVLVYIVAKHEVRHSIKFGELSRHS